jgi:hypothetical protein
MLPSDAVTNEYLSKELALAEKALSDVENKQDVLTMRAFSVDDNDNHQQQLQARNEPKPLRLLRLQKTTESLVLAQKVTEWLKSSSDGDTKHDINVNINILEETRLCLELSDILLEHSDNILDVCPSLLEETYLPLYDYVYHSMKALLCQSLRAVRYPKGCSKLQHNHKFKNVCTSLRQLEHSHRLLLQALEGGDGGGGGGGGEEEPTSSVLLELLSPLVQRIQFHFVERSEERVTSSRIDRLPEWILGYLREHVFLEGSGPVDLIKSLGDVPLLVDFFNELARLFHWVLVERNFFRDPKLAGPRSNPLIMYNGIEQLLLFDRAVQESLPSRMASSSSSEEHQGQQHVITMMDLVISQDDELIHWWMDRERESVFATLFDDESSVNVPKPLANHVSPRAEIFCALIRSVQWKASILRAPGPYVREVAVPLCSQFVDALQETCNDLRSLLCQHHRGMPPEDQLVANFNEWMEIINGTHLAAQVLLREGAWQDGMPATSPSDHDLARFGRALEKLYTVMVEEFAAAFVETILMERAKLASYLMLASHLLSSEEWEGEDADLSPELRESKVVLYYFHQACNSILLVEDDAAMISDNDHKIALFAPLAMRTHVMNRVATKFLEVALDVDNMSPAIWQTGAKIFSRDVAVVMGPSDLSLVLRLLEVTKLLSLDNKSIRSLFNALAGLVGAESFLDINDFTSDGTIYEEATSMIKAKGFSSLELEDAVSVLNRRRD